MFTTTAGEQLNKRLKVYESEHTPLQPKHIGHIWAAYYGTWFATYGAFSTYGEENPSESTTYGQHMGLYFKHMGFF